MHTRTISRAEVNKTFGRWLRIQLHKIDRPADWLHQRIDVSRGSVNRWTNGQSIGLDKSLQIIKLIAVQQQRPVVELLKDYMDYMG